MKKIDKLMMWPLAVCLLGLCSAGPVTAKFHGTNPGVKSPPSTVENQWPGKLYGDNNEAQGNNDPGTSPHASQLFEYKPAPGQFINKAPFGTPANASNVLGAPDGSIISLGGFGGFIVVGFDRPITNDPQNPYGVDFTINGNAFPNWTEPGAVMVMKDENNNGLPDDTWYELAGSEYHFSRSKKVEMTYTNPGYDMAHDVLWQTNLQEAGVLLKNNFHSQPYYPQPGIFDHVDPVQETYTGTRVNIRVDRSNPLQVSSGSLSFGYVDNKSNNRTPTLAKNPYFDDANGRSADGFDLSWAVDDQGNPVALDEVHFVKVYNAAQENAGWLGEASTEIESFSITQPDPNWVQQDYWFQLIGSAPFQVLKGESHSFEGILFKNGIPQEATASWSVSDETIATIDPNGNFTALENGQVTVEFSADPSLEPATFTLNVVELVDMILIASKTGLYIGEQIFVNAEGIDNRPAPSNRFIYDRYTFSVDNEALATVSAAGVVTAKAPGPVTITATSQSNETISASIQFTISETPAVTFAGGPLSFESGISNTFIDLDTVFTVEGNGQVSNEIIGNSNDFLVQPRVDHENKLQLDFKEDAGGEAVLTIASTAYGVTHEFDVTLQVTPQQINKPKQIVFVNGGQFGFKKGNVQVYDPVLGTTTKLTDFTRAESVQDVVAEGRYVYVSAEYDIIKYNLVTGEQVAIRRTQDTSLETADGLGTDGAGLNHSMTLYKDWLLATRQNSGAPPEDGYNLRIYNKTDLSLVKKIPVSTQASGVTVVGDSAFVALNGGFMGTSGQLAIIDLVNLELKQEYDFGSDGTGIMQIFHQQDTLYVLAQEKLLTYSIAGNTHQLHNVAIGHGDFSSSPLGTAIVGNTLYSKLNWGSSFPIHKGFGTVDLAGMTVLDNDVIGMNEDIEIQSNGYSLMASSYDVQDELFYFTFGSWWGGGTGRIYDRNGTLTGSFSGIEDSPEQMTISYAIQNQLPFLQKPLEDVALYEHETVEITLDEYFSDHDTEPLAYEVTSSTGEAVPSWITLTQGRLTATAESHLPATKLSLTVKATDPHFEQLSQEFQLEIIPVDDAPVVVNPIADKMVNGRTTEQRVSLENVFDDEDSDNANMQYSITGNSNQALVQTTFEGNELILIFSPGQYGNAQISIACLSDEKTTQTTFQVDRVDVAPVVAVPISNLHVDENAAPKTITLAGVFDDEDNDTENMQYAIGGNSNSTLVQTNLQAHELILAFAPDQYGEAEVSITCISGQKTTSTTFRVEVNKVDVGPIVARPIASLEVKENATPETLTLLGVFDDEDDDAASIVYRIKNNSNEKLVIAAIANDALQLSFAQDLYGEADITIEATSGGKSIEHTFKVMVRKNLVTGLDTDVASISVFPNPVMNDLHIRTNTSGTLFIQLVKTDGIITSDYELHANNAKIDVSGLPPGMYLLHINDGRQTITKRIFKAQ